MTVHKLIKINDKGFQQPDIGFLSDEDMSQITRTDQ